MRIVFPALAATVAVLLGQPALAGDKDQPRQHDRQKTGVTVDQSLKNLKLHRDTELGFQFYYPASWHIRPATRGSTRVKVGDGTGATCVVAVRRLSLPADATGKPRRLDGFLGRLTREQFQQRYPARFQPKILSFDTDRLGGQNARRIIVGITVNNVLPMNLMQYITYRSYGVVSLTCGAQEAAYNTPAMQRHMRTVTRSFRF